MAAPTTKRSTEARPRRARPRRPETARPETSLLHPDLVVGGLSLLMMRAANPVANTLGDVGVYFGLAADELFPAPPAKTPEVTVTARWRLPGLVSEDLVFRSPHEPLEPKFRRRYQERYRESHLVYARRIRPAAARRRPRLLYLHGYMQPETYIEEFALLTSMAMGLNVEVIQMQAPHHGRRTARASRFSGEFFWTADLVRSVEALRQTVLDARTLLGWLLEQDERPVGLTGLSLGGALALILTCVEDRFAFAIPLIAHMDLAALVSDAPVLSKMRHDLKSFGWGRREFGGFVRQMRWNELRPRLAPDEVLLIAASNDRFFDPRVVERMWQRWGRPGIHWFPTSHMGFLPYLPEALRRMREFIDERF
jgi:acetyl esterase/lipase